MKLLGLLANTGRITFFFGVLFGALSGCGTVGVIIMIAQFSHKTSADAAFANEWAAFAAFCLAVLLSRIGSRTLLRNISLRAVMQLRLKLLRNVLQSPLDHLEQVGTPQLVEAVTVEARQVAAALPEVIRLCSNLGLVLVGLGYIAWVSLQAFLISSVVLGMGIFIYVLLIDERLRADERARRQWRRVSGQMRHFILGVRELKFNNRRAKVMLEDNLRTELVKLAETNQQTGSLSDFSTLWHQSLLCLLMGYFTFMPVQHATTGNPSHHALSLTVVTLFILNALQVLVESRRKLRMASASLDQIVELGVKLDEIQIEDIEATVTTRVQERSALVLKDVAYSYNKASGEGCTPFSLKPVNAVFGPGQISFIVGENGAGKTTLLKIICGLYKPTTGTIHLGSTRIKRNNLGWFRHHFSVVFSNIHIFEQISVREAPDMGNQIVQYLARFSLDKHVTVEGQALTSSDAALSTGQRKRLALVIACLDDRPIVVLDEWAADQDPAFKHFFYTELLLELRAKGKTVIAITHDQQYFYVADQVLNLSTNRMTTPGPANDALLAKATSS